MGIAVSVVWRVVIVVVQYFCVSAQRAITTRLGYEEGVRVILEGDGFEVVIGDVEGKRGYTKQTIYLGTGTGADATNLEVGVVVEVDEVGVSLGETGECSGSVELCFE